MSKLYEAIKTTDIKIYVADMAAYRDGLIRGVWLDPAEPVGILQTQIDEMLAKSPITSFTSSEWAIHDYRGFPPFYVGLPEDLEAVHQKALLAHRSEDLLTAVLAHFDGDYDAASDALDEDCDQGAYQSVAAYAQDRMESNREISTELSCFVDYDAMGRDMVKSDEIFTIDFDDDDIHIFLTEIR